MTFRITSPDALPLSYRRLVGGKATKLWVYVTNQWRIQTFRWGGGSDQAPRASPLDLPLQTLCILLGLECHCSMHDVFLDLCF